METFADPKALVKNPLYRDQRLISLERLNDMAIDPPIARLIHGFNQLPYCFTLQSCYGHFVYNGRRDPHNLEPLPFTHTIDRVEYRIAYIAFCIDYSESGKIFLDALKAMEKVDPENIQFCCAEWFWQRQVNSYALQVEPDRFKFKDRAILPYQEALKIEKIRNEFFVRLSNLLQKDAFF